MNDKELLRAIYSAQLRDGAATIRSVSLALGGTPEEARPQLEECSRKRLVDIRGQEVRLTPNGRKELTVVMIGGAFEIIHPGHIHTIAEAKRLGDTLVVVLATDKAVAKNKGREPVTTQEWRVKLASALRGVDVAIPGGQGSIYDTMEKVGPDIVALGYDQKHDPLDIENEARNRGMKLSVVRLDSPMPGVKTSKIVSTL